MKSVYTGHHWECTTQFVVTIAIAYSMKSVYTGHHWECTTQFVVTIAIAYRVQHEVCLLWTSLGMHYSVCSYYCYRIQSTA